MKVSWLYLLIGALSFASGVKAAPEGGVPGLTAEQRFALYSRQARDDDPAAQYQLAQMYAGGRGTRRDYRAARRWYQQAADGGSVMAVYQLGVLHYRGLGGPRDFDKARGLFTRAAQQGYAGAQYMLATMYVEGVGVTADEKLARRWYRQAADNGHQGARLALQALLPKGMRRSDISSLPPPANLLISVYKRDWSRSEDPAQVLPSSMTRCEWTAGDEFQCLSDTMFRHSGDLDILYRTRARIKRQAPDRLQISYRNNIISVNNNNGKDPGPSALGWQDQEHVLRCKASDPNSLTCINERDGHTVYTATTTASAATRSAQAR